MSSTAASYGAADPRRPQPLAANRGRLSSLHAQNNATPNGLPRNIFVQPAYRSCSFRKYLALAIIFALLFLLFFVELTQSPTSASAFIARSQTHLQDTITPTILISLDGFRHEYLSRKKTVGHQIKKPLAPNLLRLAANGARAVNGMQPVMPTKTRPNHWALATGLFAESGGIVANEMYDPIRHVWFKNTRADPDWYSGSPIWHTLRNTRRSFLDARGVPWQSSVNFTTACVGWPGSEVRKYAANVVWEYDENIPYEDRVIKAVSLLNGTSPDLQGRAHFVTLYLKAVDEAGHTYGPNSHQVNEAIEKVDNAVGFLLGLLGKQAAERYNIVVVSDHGMTEMKPHKTVDLTPNVKPGTVQDITVSPLGLFMNISVPAEEVYSNIQKALKSKPDHAKVYLKEGLPARWRLRESRLITRVVTMADLGSKVKYPHQYILTGTDKMTSAGESSDAPMKGNHGFDNLFEDMQAIFVAQGPSFKVGSAVENLRAVDIYEMLCHMFSAAPRPNNGSLQITMSSILKPHR